MSNIFISSPENSTISKLFNSELPSSCLSSTLSATPVREKSTSSFPSPVLPTIKAMFEALQCQQNASTKIMMYTDDELHKVA
jgi:hypothetical protein